MAKARSTASAETDLLDLWLFIAEDNLLAADNAVDSIYRSAQLLAEQHMMGRARPELAAGLRSFPTQAPYILFHFPDDAG
jgi:plasmid stabilization system protein ParE